MVAGDKCGTEEKGVFSFHIEHTWLQCFVGIHGPQRSFHIFIGTGDQQEVVVRPLQSSTADFTQGARAVENPSVDST